VAEQAGVLTVGGADRTFQVVHPEPAHASSLVLVLHGSDSDAPRFRELSGHTFDRLTDVGAVLVYAEAYGGVWNDARLGTRSPARERGLDDVEFLSALIARLREEYAVPAERVFAVGFSNGGQMVMRLAAQAPDLIAGAAVISSNHPTPDNVLAEMADLDRHRPMPVLTINGTRDPIVPFDGGVASLWGSAPRGRVLSSAASAALFAARNGITEPPVSVQVTSGEMATTLTRWRQAGRAPVAFYAVEDGGHTVPNRQQDAPLLLGRTQRDLDTGELVADFFGLGSSGPGSAVQRRDQASRAARISSETSKLA
jgi:polyhydroxybutyrate depolymerase